jgi:hypothetical protein
MLYKVKEAVCSEIRTKHIKAMSAACRIFECYTGRYVKLPLGFKRLISVHKEKEGVAITVISAGGPRQRLEPFVLLGLLRLVDK